MSKSIQELTARIIVFAEEKGWNELDTSIESLSKQLVNFHAEISEAWEELRNGHSIHEIYYGKDFKPEGFSIEIADLLIRILHTCGFYGIPIENLIEMKMDYNEKRPFRHGGKLA